MKKTVSLLTVFLIAFCSLHAQERNSKFLAEISIGPSIPIGQFAERSYKGIEEKDQPGMAKTGIAANVSLGYYIKENVGLLLTVGYSENKQRPESLEEYIEGTQYSIGTEVDVTTTSWKNIKVMAGGFLVTPLKEDKLNFITKLSAGFCTPIVPGYTWHAHDVVWPVYADGGVGKDRLPVTFCYQISLGLQYKMNSRTYLLFDINSFNATATNKGAPRSGGSLPDTKYKLGSVSTLLGVGLNF